MASWLRPFRRQQTLALPIFGAAMILYALTLAPTVVALFDDSLEFQLVAHQLGIAHPTGYPLYTILAWLFTQVPAGDVAYRVNLLSAVFGALTVALVYLIGLEMAAGHRSDDSQQCWPGVLGAVIGAVALAVSPIFWSQATVAEVYTLNSTFMALILLMVTRAANNVQWQSRAPDQRTAGNDASASVRPQPDLLAPALGIAFVFGLALTHHRTILLLLPAILLVFWRMARLWRKVNSAPQSDAASDQQTPEGTPDSVAAWLWGGMKLVITFASPLLLYLYLPLRGHIGSLDGSYTNTLAGFWQHITASGYGGFIFQNPMAVERNLLFYLTLFVKQFGWVGFVAGLIGLIVLNRRRLTGGITEIAFVTYGAFNLIYRVSDIQVFFVPLFLIWAIWVGRGGGWLLTVLHGRVHHPDSRVTGRLAAHLGLVVAGLLLTGQSMVMLRNNLPEMDRSDDWAVYDYGQDIMAQPLEPNAAIVGIQGEITLIRYFQATEQLRPDLAPLAVDNSSQRREVVSGLLDQGLPVYLTRDLPGAPRLWSLNAVGPLIQVSPQPVMNAPATATVVNTPIITPITLHGYTISRPPSHAQLAPLRLTLVWQAAAAVPQELKVSARLLTTDGGLVAQTDAVPVHFTYPTTAWRSGEYVTDVYDLPLPDSLPAGEYTPVLILYDPAQGAAEVGRVALPTIYLP